MLESKTTDAQLDEQIKGRAEDLAIVIGDKAMIDWGAALSYVTAIIAATLRQTAAEAYERGKADKEKSDMTIKLEMLHKQLLETKAMCRTTGEWIVLKRLIEVLIEENPQLKAAPQPETATPEPKQMRDYYQDISALIDACCFTDNETLPRLRERAETALDAIASVKS